MAGLPTFTAPIRTALTPRRRWLSWVWALTLISSTAAFAQVDLVDPDAKVQPKKKSRRAAEGEDAPTGIDAVDPDAVPAPPAELPRAAPPPVVPAAAAATPKRGKDGKELKAPPKVEEPAPPPPPMIQVTTVRDGDLDAAWSSWRLAAAANNVKAEQQARATLLKLKKSTQAPALEAWAMGLMRGARAAQARGDSGAAVEMALTAVELAERSPAVWSSLGEIYFAADPTDFGRFLGAFKKAIALHFGDVRYRRSLLADFGSIALSAFVMLLCVYVLVLVVRRGRYFLYDFHFFFPRGAARWQTAALGILVLLLPIVFRLGLVATLLTAFFAIALYLTQVERIVVAVLVGLLGVVPLAAEALVEQTAFGESAEQLRALDDGGAGTEPLVATVLAQAREGKATPEQLFAVGTWQLRRGLVDDAITQLKGAAAMRSKDGRTLANLAAAYLLQGDLDNAKELLDEAIKADGTLAAPQFNLGRYYEARFALLGDAAAGDVGRADGAFSNATRLGLTKPSAPLKDKGAMPASEAVRLVGLSHADFAAAANAGDAPARVRSQMTQLLIGPVHEGLAVVLPALLALLAVGFGQLGLRLRASKVCNKCGRPVSSRGDPELSAGSLMCAQCVNVFAKKNAVVPSLKVRKQLEVARYHTQTDRISSVLGLLFAGMGHVFAGFPIAGLLYGLTFSTAIVGVLWRNGAVRAPYDGLPVGLRLVPLVVFFVVVYLLALRGLRKRQSRS